MQKPYAPNKPILFERLCEKRNVVEFRGNPEYFSGLLCLLLVASRNNEQKTFGFLQNTRYTVSMNTRKKFDPRFTPNLTPKEMLELGVFGGLYFSDKPKEFPKSWFTHAKLSPDGKQHKELNYFGVNASQPLAVWQAKGWIHPQDPRGWFQWYCRYYQGRRTEDDERQIKRWLAMQRHVAQIKNNCRKGDVFCRPKQRQALLHWAYDTRKL